MSSCLDNKAEVVFSGYYPLGFFNEYAFANFIFGFVNHSDMPDDVQPVFHGSSVTGVSHDTKRPFDEGRVSDFDIAIVSDTLWNRVLEKGVGTRTGTKRTGELQPEDIIVLQLSTVYQRVVDLVRGCSTQARPVHFMIYADQASATQGKAALVTYLDTGSPKGKRRLLLAQLCGTVG
jgi:hypothetical protein